MFENTQPLSAQEARNINPVVLAYVGDAVYSLYVRENLVKSTDFKTGQLQKLSSGIVSAHGQSELLERLLPLFTEEEGDIFRRGRNAKKGTKSKNASVGEYNRSTGFEAVLGYLYLTGNCKRIEFLLKEEYEDRR
ncbi:MAG: Mini-ribonuclease 3 [Clostridia bacterium]|nr:Mini-ribonuclease 3 [Clostridia bacterium]MCD8309073.1 Mini-ribonuclease 3 [Clostridia bacterium]